MISPELSLCSLPTLVAQKGERTDPLLTSPSQQTTATAPTGHTEPGSCGGATDWWATVVFP